MDIQRVLAFKYSSQDFSLGETYESLNWFDHNTIPKPTLDEIEAASVEYEAYKAATLYQLNRQAEYPSLNDLVVAIWEKVIENRPESADALQTKRAQIKAKYPKPE